MTTGRNRRAIVTGGSGGLGQAVVARLKRDGMAVAVLDRARPQGEQTNFDLFCECDVTNEESVQAAVQETVARLGGVDVLVNNAGLQGPVSPLVSVSLEEWQRVLDVNLTGTFLCCRAVIPIMVKSGWGRIVTISSLQGKEGTAEAGPYAASKAAQIALTKTLAKELATSGVTVNCVTPTVIDGGMVTQISATRRADLLSRIPMARFGTTDEFAAMVSWVASEECSFTTGAVFDLSGGRATW